MNYPQSPNYSTTQTKILDAAEQLFAKQGLHATTLRTITSAAAVNLAAVNYHFGSKEQLIKAVLLRRLIPLNKDRSQQLTAVLQRAAATQQPARVADLLRSFIEPTIRFSQVNQAHKDFMVIVSSLMMDPNNEFRHLFLNQVEPLIEQLISALATVLPDIAPSTLQLRLQFTIGSIVFAMRQVQVPSMTDGQPQMAIEPLIDELTTFVSYGMERS